MCCRSTSGMLFFSLFVVITLGVLSRPSNGQSQSPGVKVRLTQKAFDYFNSVLDDVLAQSLPGASIPSVQQSFVGGTISLTNLVISDYKRPTSLTTDLKSPNLVTWSLQHMNIGIRGQFDINYALQKGNGGFSGTASDLSITQQMALTSNNRMLNINANGCKASIKNLNFDITTDNVNLKTLFDLNKATLMLVVKSKMEQEMCTQFKRILSVDVNNQLQKAGSKIRLIDSQQKSEVSSPVKIPPEVDNLMRQLYLDYGLVKDPVINNNFVDIYSRGEISYLGQGGTPFDPLPLPSSGSTDKMISVLVSDFLANSMFYNAFQHQLLRFRVNADNYPSVSKYLSTGSCGQNECLGSVMPQLRTSYPSAKMEILADASDAPKITVTSNNANVLLKGVLTLLATQSGRSDDLLKAQLNAEANTNLFVVDDAIKGKLNIKTLSLKLISNDKLKSVDQSVLDSWSKGGKDWIEAAAGVLLDVGLPIPVSTHGKLINPKLSFNDRYIGLDTDVQVNKTNLVQQVKKRMQQSSLEVIKMKVELL